MARIEEIIIWIDDKENIVAFKRVKKGDSMSKMSIEDLRKIVCGGKNGTD